MKATPGAPAMTVLVDRADDRHCWIRIDGRTHICEPLRTARHDYWIVTRDRTYGPYGRCRLLRP